MLSALLLCLSFDASSVLETKQPVVHLKDGTTVSCFVTDTVAKKTWLGDGRPFKGFMSADAPSDPKLTTTKHDRRLLVIRFQQPGEVKGSFTVQRVGPPLLTGLSQSSSDGELILALDLFSDRNPADDFKFGYARGDWKTLTTYSAGKDVLRPQGFLIGFQECLNDRQPKSGRRYVVVHTKFPHGLDPMAIRLVAFDREGKKYMSESNLGPDDYSIVGPYSAGPFPDTEHGEVSKVGLPLKNLARIIVQVRPYNWIVFKGVDLNP